MFKDFSDGPAYGPEPGSNPNFKNELTGSTITAGLLIPHPWTFAFFGILWMAYGMYFLTGLNRHK
jgi:hypothetical protein